MAFNHRGRPIPPSVHASRLVCNKPNNTGPGSRTNENVQA